MYYIEKIKSNIGPQIKKARIKAKMSQSELALKCNLSKNSRFTVINWESGKTTPNFEQLCDLCKVFDCEMTFFFGDECTTRDIQFIHDVTGFSESAIRMLSFYKHTPSMDHIVYLLDDLILDRGTDGINTLSQIASIAYAIMATRADIPASELQANMNYAGLNWNCQQMFMQFIDRYTKI